MIRPDRVAMVPVPAIADRRLSPAAFKLLAALGSCNTNAGWCSPSYDELAAKAGIGRRSVTRIIPVLVECRYLEVNRRRSVDGRAATNEYRVRFDLTDAEIAAALAARGPEGHTEPPEGQRARGPEGQKANLALGETPMVPGDVDEGLRPEGQDGPPPHIENARARGLDKPLKVGEETLLHTTSRARTKQTRLQLAQELIAIGAPGIAKLGDPAKGGRLRSETFWFDRWAQAGYDLEADIKPVIERVGSKAIPDSITSWSYFGPALAEHYAKRTAPIESAKPGPPRASLSDLPPWLEGYAFKKTKSVADASPNERRWFVAKFGPQPKGATRMSPVNGWLGEPVW